MFLRRSGSWRGWAVSVVLSVVAGLRAAGADAAARDILVYKDGDRIHGRVLRREGDVLVFQADRFGEVRVKAADAVVIKGEPPPVPARPAPTLAAAPASPRPVTPKPEPKSAETHAEEEKLFGWEWFSPSVLTARLREFFGPWHGRLALSSDVVADTAERNSYAVDATMRRKWERDEVQINGRLDYAQTNDVTTTDTIKGTALWRHDFNKRQFAQYRPTLEFNRANRRAGVPNDYVLLQQEIGSGISLVSTPTRKVRAGVSQNLFDLWNSAPVADHTSRGVQSTFEELELTLPWRMGLTQRGVWYPVRDRDDGWENRLELNKKLTETLSASLRHEIRRNNPDGTAQDYTRLKLLVGLDF
ncbi:MAG: DUF481 domain-containing protein [Verrucomicrobia bacterium]|nr:DUF481 domain-containing protein [Verrucomicrobiota bacterium]